MNDYTPGPWEVDAECCDVVTAYDGDDDSRLVIAERCGDDAPIIAAAPDMYEALTAMVELFDGYQGMQLSAAKAALAKAREKQ